MREHLRRPSGDPSWCDTLRSDFTHKGVKTRQLNEYRSQLGARGKTATHTVTADKVLARNKERARERETESSGWNMYEVVYNVCRQWWCQPLRGGTHGHQGRRKTAVTSWWTRDAQRLFSFFVFLTPQLHLCSYSSSPPSGPDAPPRSRVGPQGSYVTCILILPSGITKATSSQLQLIVSLIDYAADYLCDSLVSFQLCNKIVKK